MQGLTNKIDYLGLVGRDTKANIMAVAEHWLTKQECDFLAVPGYQTASCYCRPNRAHGGTALFVDNKMGLKIRDLNTITKLSVEMVCEACAIEIHELNLVVISLYIPFNDDQVVFDQFLSVLNDMLGLALRKNSSLVIAADFNVKFESSHKYKIDLCNLLNSYGLKITINYVTRPGINNISNSGTCIDNIATNIDNSRYNSYVFHTVLSDHDALIFKANVTSVSSTRLPSGETQQSKELHRPINQGSTALFRSLLNSINWVDVYATSNDSNKFIVFFDLFMWAVNTAFPLIKRNSRANKPDYSWYDSSLCELKKSVMKTTIYLNCIT